MKHGLSVVADLTGGDAEMQRAVQEVIKAFGGLDIIVNRCALHARVYAAPPSAGACRNPSLSVAVPCCLATQCCLWPLICWLSREAFSTCLVEILCCLRDPPSCMTCGSQ